MKVSLDGLNKSQMEAFVRLLEERGEELFPGK
jgi:succinate dehydrogenase flavin-adding protein (antitoxin of CptAB toxin-antitoxin module)